MATKKRKAPNKTRNHLTAAAQAALPAPKETIDQAAEVLASLAAATVAAVLEGSDNGAESRRLGSVSERRGVTREAPRYARKEASPNGGYPDSLIFVVRRAKKRVK